MLSSEGYVCSFLSSQRPHLENFNSTFGAFSLLSETTMRTVCAILEFPCGVLRLYATCPILEAIFRALCPVLAATYGV